MSAEDKSSPSPFTRRHPLTKRELEDFAKIVSETSEKIEKEETQKIAMDPLVLRALRMVENHISRRKLVVYGGTALNAVMPPRDRFYDPEHDLPDWDFFSDTPIEDAIKVADDVHEKTGMETFVTTAAHHGTYKVYADGNAIADITEVPENIMEMLRKHALLRDDVLYSGPNYLRMAAYLELGRPRGQVERWEKVFRRLMLLNKNHPIQIRPHNPEEPGLGKEVRERIVDTLADLQREMNANMELGGIAGEFQAPPPAGSGGGGGGDGGSRKKEEYGSFAFFGPEAIQLIKRTLRRSQGEDAPNLGIPDEGFFPMILAANPTKVVEECSRALRKNLMADDQGFSEITTVSHEGKGEFLPPYYEVRGYAEDGGKSITLCLVIGTSNGCQSVYKLPTRDHGSLNIASIESAIYIYLAIHFADILPVPASMILKTCDELVQLQYKIFRENTRPLLPVPSACIGRQETIRDMRKEKSRMLKEIIENKGRRSAEYYEWNIRYNGGDEKERKVILRMLERERKREQEEEKKQARKKADDVEKDGSITIRSLSVKRSRAGSGSKGGGGGSVRRTLKQKR
jgi:hypothetical protein